MVVWITVIIWAIASLFTSTSAAPLEQIVRALAATNNSVATRTINIPPYTHSIQILLKRDRGDYYYEFWQGPEGIAVNECAPDPNFTNFIGKGPYRGDPGMIDQPATPPETKVAVRLDQQAKGCNYVSSGNDFGQLRCSNNEDGTGGDWLIADFMKDPDYDGYTWFCSDGCMYHRGFYVEW